MKLDNEYSSAWVCPNRSITLSPNQLARNTCPYCGCTGDLALSHARIIAGKWERPSMLEWLKGERKVFIEITME